MIGLLPGAELPDLEAEPLRTLKTFLEGPRKPQNALSLLALDGYLAAVAVSPELVATSEMLSRVWDGPSPAFLDGNEGQSVLAAIMARQNQIDGQIENHTLAPLYLVGPAGEAQQDRIREWANGFWDGMQLCPDAWMELLQEQRFRSVLAPIVCFASDERGDLFQPSLVEVAELRSMAGTMIPVAVSALRFLLRERTTPMEEPRRVQRIGRNEPCPCCSGRKYKRCCGA